jgi:hypothetical protein
MKPTLSAIEKRINALETRADVVDTSALILRELYGDTRTPEAVQQIASGRPVVILPPKVTPEEWTAHSQRARVRDSMAQR